MKDEQYLAAANFWKRKDSAANRMDASEVWKEADRYLTSHKVCALATGGGDCIRCTPLEYSWHDGAVWIFSEGGRKFTGLLLNKAVSLAVFDLNTGFGGLHSLQMSGTAEVFDDVDDSRYVAEAASRKIPLATLRNLDEPMYLIRIEPDEVTLLNSDFRKRGFGSRQTAGKLQEGQL